MSDAEVGDFFVVVYLVIVAWVSWVNIRICLGSPGRRPADVSRRNLAPPRNEKRSIATLEALGFHRLGEAEVPLPHVRTRPYWILVNSDNSIQAEAVRGRVSFSTFFDDKVLLVTDYPNGEHLQTPIYECRTITTSIKDALDYHKLQVDKFRARYGSPQSISDMVDYVHWEVVGRVHYSLMRLQWWFRLYTALLILSVCGAILILIRPGLSWGLNRLLTPTELAQDVLEPMTTLITWCLLIPLLLAVPILGLWAMYRERRDSRKIRPRARQAEGRGQT